MLNIISFNVNGMLSNEKYMKVIATIKNVNSDFALIQETHWGLDHKVNSTTWNGDIYSSSYKKGARGVAIFVSKKYQRQVEHVEKDKEGRYIIIKVKIEDKIYTIINVYANNSPHERAELLQRLKGKVMKHDMNIIGGDFNIWQSVLDVNKNMTWCNDISRKTFFEFKRDCDVVDIWRQRYANVQVFSRHQFVKNVMKQSRIDLFLTSMSLNNRVVNISYQPTTISDHCILIMKMDFEQVQRGPGVWILNNTFLEDRDYCIKIETCIENEKQSELYDLDTLLWWDNTKYKLKKISQLYGKNKSKERNREIYRIRNKLSEYYSKIAHSDDEYIISKIKELEHELQVLENIKCKGAIIRSKAQWATECDRNTSFFLQLENTRQNSNSVKELFDENRTIHRNTEAIMDIEYKFYKELYTKEDTHKEATEQMLSNIDLFLSEDDKSVCDEDISTEEIKYALFGMALKKSPGGDGLTTEFYRHFYGILEPIIYKIYNEMFKKGHMSKSMKCGIINLIYKNKGDKRELKNWRPISLLNVDYKVIARCLSNRLKGVISSLINENQTCCIPRRDISDNVASIRDVIELIETEKLEGYICKIDQLKAFDMVSHDYLFSVLSKFGFGNSFIKWVHVLYNGIRSAVKCNGHVTSYFNVERSVRQGCPLSAMLYVLCAEPFSLALRKNLEKYSIDIPDTENKSLVYQHADDTTLTISSLSALPKLQETIEIYTKASGGKINFDKSEILPLGNGIDKIKQVDVKFRIANNVLEVLGIYLGTDRERCEHLNWNLKVQKAKSLLAYWKQRKLSLYGKSIVINTLLLSKFYYVLNVQPLPNNIELTIKDAIKDFMWGKKPPGIAYTTLIGKKDEGGLNITDIGVKRDAFRLKTIKKFLSDVPNIWKHIMSFQLKKYGKMELSDSVLHTVILEKHMKHISAFYQELLRAWKKFKDNVIDDVDITQVYKQPLFLNPKIKCDDNILFFEDFIAAGICSIADICYEYVPGILKNEIVYDLLNETLPDTCTANFESKFQRIINAIPKEWVKHIETHCNVKKQGQEFIVLFNNRNIPFSSVDTKTMSTLLTRKMFKQPASIHKWKIQFRNLNFNNLLWKNIFHPWKNPDCVDMDYKLYHRHIFTMNRLYAYGLEDSPACRVCKTQNETLIHMIHDCDHLKIFHDYIVKMLEVLMQNTPVGFMNTIDYSQLLIFGITSKISNVNNEFINFVLSTARFAIIKRRQMATTDSKIMDIIRFFNHTLLSNINDIFYSEQNKNRFEIFTDKLLYCNPLISIEDGDIKFKL